MNPDQPVKLVATKGGSQDYAARFLCPALGRELGQPVEMQIAASGFVPAQTVMKSAPDGHTLLLSGRLMWLMQQAREDCPYDLLRDFIPIAQTTRGTQVLVVRPDLPVNSVGELLALARAKPGQLKFASTPAGGNNHLAPELMKAMAGVDIQCVECNSPQRLEKLLSGEVQMFFTGICSFAEQIKAGILKPLGLTSQQRSPLYPELPTISEFVPGYENITVGALFAPAGTPPAVVKRLTEATLRVMHTAEAGDYFAQNGYEAVGAGPDELIALMRADIGRVGRLIKELGLQRMEE